VHINRLKKTCEQKQRDNRILPTSKQGRQRIKLDRTGDTSGKECFASMPELSRGASSQMQVVESESKSLSEIDEEETVRLSQGHQDDSDWTPGSVHLRRKLHSDKTTDDVAFQLRSRVVSRSGQNQGSETVRTETSDSLQNDNAQSFMLFDEAMPTASHSYNLRSRVGSMPADAQAK